MWKKVVKEPNVVSVCSIVFFYVTFALKSWSAVRALIMLFSHRCVRLFEYRTIPEYGNVIRIIHGSHP